MALDRQTEELARHLAHLCFVLAERLDDGEHRRLLETLADAICAAAEDDSSLQPELAPVA
jgi:hypothetical protein